MFHYKNGSILTEDKEKSEHPRVKLSGLLLCHLKSSKKSSADFRARFLFCVFLFTGKK
jgi:hypothetical protein